MSTGPVLLSIAPIFLLIVLGHALRRGGIPNTEFWNMNDRLVYLVLMPALLFQKVSSIELSPDSVGLFASVILGGFVAALIFGLLSARAAALGAPEASSLMQGTCRHNTFIALSVTESLFGAPGLALGALATAILIPVTNLSVVSLMVTLTQPARVGGVFPAILRDLARNPLLLSVGAGIAVNLSGLGPIPVLHETATLLGAAALPVVLLCVGANLHPSAMRASALPLALAVLGKFLIFPAVTVVLALMLDLTRLETMVALLFSAAPTASSAYTLARQMGGDAPLMAAITTIQTGLAFVTLPLSLLVVDALF